MNELLERENNEQVDHFSVLWNFGVRYKVLDENR